MIGGRWERPERRRRTRRADDRQLLAMWTRGEHEDYADDMKTEIDGIASKVDRLAWIVAIGSGIVAASAFFIGLRGGL